MSLERFHEVQGGRSAGYDTVVAEIRAGTKHSHWIWYIFPQIEASVIHRPRELTPCEISAKLARTCVIQSCVRAMKKSRCQQLTRGIRVEDLMGGRTDALKLVSNLTLFRVAAEQLGREDPVYASLAEHLAALLEQTAEQGYPACDFTLAGIDSVRRDLQ